MADIATDDVRTYIVELIEKELGSCDQGDNSAARSRKTNTRRPKNPQSHQEFYSNTEEKCDE
jgi:hypothetical protein